MGPKESPAGSSVCFKRPGAGRQVCECLTQRSLTPPPPPEQSRLLLLFLLLSAREQSAGCTSAPKTLPLALQKEGLCTYCEREMKNWKVIFPSRLQALNKWFTFLSILITFLRRPRCSCPEVSCQPAVPCGVVTGSSQGPGLWPRASKQTNVHTKAFL